MVSIFVGCIFTIYWAVMPFIKPDPILLMDDIVELDEELTELPDEELAEINTLMN